MATSKKVSSHFMTSRVRVMFTKKHSPKLSATFKKEHAK